MKNHPKKAKGSNGQIILIKQDNDNRVNESIIIIKEIFQEKSSKLGYWYAWWKENI